MDAPAVAVKVCCNEVEKAWLQLVPVAVYEERGHAAVHRTTHAALVRQAPPQERHALVRGQPATAAAAAAAAAKTAAFVASVATRADAKEKEYAGGRERAHGLVPREERLAERQRRHVSRAAARQQRRRHAHKLRGVVRVELRQVPSGQGGGEEGFRIFRGQRVSGCEALGLREWLVESSAEYAIKSILLPAPTRRCRAACRRGLRGRRARLR